MSEEDKNRRRFERISFDAPVEIEQDGLSWLSHVVDISLKGILVDGDDLTFNIDRPVNILINLGQEAKVHLQATWANTHKSGHAFSWTNIELESMIHLRRLLQLNAEDDELIDRELAKLGEGF